MALIHNTPWEHPLIFKWINRPLDQKQPEFIVLKAKNGTVYCDGALVRARGYGSNG